MISSAATCRGRPSGPKGALSTGFWYILGMRIVWLMVGLLCRREHLSPCRQALRGSDKGKRAGHTCFSNQDQSLERLCGAGCDHAGCRARVPAAGACCSSTAHTAHCAAPDLVVKRTVDTILLRAEDACQVLSHSSRGPTGPTRCCCCSCSCYSCRRLAGARLPHAHGPPAPRGWRGNGSQCRFPA